MWTLIGRAAMNLFLPTDSGFFFMRAFVKTTDPVLRLFRPITPGFLVEPVVRPSRHRNLREAGAPWQGHTQAPVRVLDRTALAGAARIAEVGGDLGAGGDACVGGELAAVVAGEGASRRRRQRPQLGDDGAGAAVGIHAAKTPGDGQPGAAILEGEQGLGPLAEVHHVALPVADLLAKIGFFRPLVHRHPVADRQARAPAPAAAALVLALPEQPRQPALASLEAPDVAVDGLHR